MTLSIDEINASLKPDEIPPENLGEVLSVIRDLNIEACKTSFWHFCKILAPDFYKDDRWHLKVYCDTLQKLYERKLLNEHGEPYENLIIEMPPRHGKSRTLTLFNAWVLGLDNTNSIITASYNDDLAQTFSRSTRDIISAPKNDPLDINYADIFTARIKKGNASYQEWALEGRFFSYKGSGVGGSVTGKGSKILEMDDLVKDAETAYNEGALDKVWLWYTGTFVSRAENAIKILSMTPWCKSDPGARLQKLQPGKWYLLSLPAYKDGKMLCPEILSYDQYKELKEIGDQKIITANYDLERIDAEGSLYGELKTYDRLPDNPIGIVGVCDTADEGKDYLCAILGQQDKDYIYVTDVLYTQAPQEQTEPELASMIELNGTRHMMIESNNGGRAFARNVERLLKERGNSCVIEWFHQTENKQSRILTNAPQVKSNILMPVNWEHKWPDFYLAMIGYQREGKNKHDDAPDCATIFIDKFLSRQTAFDDDIIAVLKARRDRV